jgi:pseudouridine-5'-phosphate glycosidase
MILCFSGGLILKQELPPFFQQSDEVTRALESSIPVVALESTVITHGLPYPQNFDIALEMESEVRIQGVIPATIAVLDGKIRIGLGKEEFERLSQAKEMHKLSVGDLSTAVAKRWSGGTTVAGSIFAAARVGIRIFATGGIGGVHRGEVYDISADMSQLAKTPIIVVCAGAKAILDLPATLEYLETNSVPIVGYQTDEFPAFFSRNSGLKINASADSAPEIAEIANAHWKLGLSSSVLVVNPPPQDYSMNFEQVEEVVDTALADAGRLGIKGKQVTPYLLKRVSELTSGASLKVNLELLRSNASLAARIAKELV